MPKAAKCRPSRGKGAPRGGRRSRASTTSGTGRRGVAGKGQSRPRNDDGKYCANGAGWNEFFKLLEEFKEANGHCNPPTKRRGSLGNWVNDQRRLYREDKLAQERIDRLDTLGFDWGSSYKERWEKNYKQLIIYKKKHGHCRVPKSHGQLGIWVNNQRRTYRKESLEERLAQDRIDRLDDLGFCWGATREDRWNGKFEDLKEFKKKHGHCRVPASHGALGTWVDYQRVTYRKGKLAPKHVDLLDDIGFEWDPPRGRPPACVSDNEDAIVETESSNDKVGPERSDNSRKSPPESLGSPKPDGTSQQQPKEERVRKRRREQGRENPVLENHRKRGRRETNSGAMPAGSKFEGTHAQAANNRASLPSSRTSDGPSEQDLREARRRRLEQRREISAAITSEVSQSVGAANTESGAEANSAVDFAAPGFARLRITIKEGLRGIVLSEHPENKFYSVISHVPSNSNAAGNGPEIFDIIRPPRSIQIQGNHSATEEWFHQHLESLPAKVSVFRKYSWDADINRALSKAFPDGKCCSFKYFVHSIIIRECGNVGITVREEPFGEVNMTVITRVEPHSVGKNLGLKRGDIICKPTRRGVKLSNLHEWFKERISYNSTDDLPPFAFKVLRLQDRAKLKRMLS